MAAMRRNWRAIAALGLSAVVAAGVFRAAIPVEAAEPAVVATREAVYAAFTVNLTRFITWPKEALGAPGQPFTIGTFPRDPINEELDTAVRGEQVAGHPVRTIRLQSFDDIANCQIVFFSRGMANPRDVLAHTAHRPILTVSDADGFLELGGHVRFVRQPGHTGLQISAVNLRSSQLEARAQLLRVAAAP